VGASQPPRQTPTIKENLTIVNKLFHFNSPQEQYRADAAVIWCFDHRFDSAFREFLRQAGVHRMDSIQAAGGAKNLASAERESDREFILEQLRISIRLHATQRVILMVHSDCGAYGGLARFEGDRSAEFEYLSGELQRAAEVVRRAFPSLRIETRIADFEGVWAPELPAELGSACA
jgi:carbonic anhydrase